MVECFLFLFDGLILKTVALKWAPSVVPGLALSLDGHRRCHRHRTVQLLLIVVCGLDKQKKSMIFLFHPLDSISVPFSLGPPAWNKFGESQPRRVVFVIDNNEKLATWWPTRVK